MRTGMKRGKKAIGLGLGILLELSALQVYAAVTEDLPPVSSGEEIEATEKVSPTAESVMKKFIALEEEMETGESGSVDELEDGISALLADGDELEINEANFPDEQFRSWVSGYDGYGDNQEWDWTKRDGKLSADEIARIRAVNVDREDPSRPHPACYDLTGIEHFTALTYLICRFNQLTSLDVSQNTALTRLNCVGNQLTSLDVSQNKELEELWCGGNQLTSLDVSQNTALTRFNCASTNLTSLDVSRNTALTELGCQQNQLTSLDVSQNTALESLLCCNNQLTSLDVSRNTALTWLKCDNNQLSCLDLSNTDLEADGARIDIGNQTIEINDSRINMLAYDSKFDVSRVSSLNGLVLADGVFVLADGAESGSYVYDVMLPSGKSIPMEVTIKRARNPEEEGGSGSGEGGDSGNGTDEGSVSGNGAGGGSEGDGSQEETTEGNSQVAISEIIYRILGNRVQISGGGYIYSSIGGVYIEKTIVGVAVITPKKSVAEAVLTAADINNGTNISLYVCDSRDKEKKKALKNIADGMGKKVMAYINVDMYSISRQGTVKTIRTASRPVAMRFGVPKAFVNPAHSYSVVYMDDNGKTATFPDTDKDDKTITIETDVFGVYMIVY